MSRWKFSGSLEIFNLEQKATKRNFDTKNTGIKKKILEMKNDFP